MFRFALVTSLIAAASSATAQCFSVAPFGGNAPNFPMGIISPGGTVNALTSFDVDGAGPTPPALVVAGDFGSSGGASLAWYGGSTAGAAPYVSEAVIDLAQSTSTIYALTASGYVHWVTNFGFAGRTPQFSGGLRSIDVHNGVLHAVGSQPASVSLSGSPIQRFLGGMWQSVTPVGLSGEGVAIATDPYRQQLFVGGALAHSGVGCGGSLPVQNLVSLPDVCPGAPWSNAPEPISHIKVRETAVVTGGGRYLSVWDLSLGARMTTYLTNDSVTAIFADVDGDFVGTASGRLFRIRRTQIWNGTWQNAIVLDATGVVANGAITAIHRHEGDLFIAGAFDRVNGTGVSAVCRLLNTGAPQFSEQPATQQVFATETLTLAAPVANATDVTFQWFLGTTPLSNGLGQNGQLIAGANTPVLTIQRPRVTMSGAYTLRATNPCGTTTSSPAVVTVIPACDSIDFNNDDVFPDDQDVIAFFRVLAGGQCFE